MGSGGGREAATDISGVTGGRLGYRIITRLLMNILLSVGLVCAGSLVRYSSIHGRYRPLGGALILFAAVLFGCGFISSAQFERLAREEWAQDPSRAINQTEAGSASPFDGNGRFRCCTIPLDNYLESP